MDYVNVSLRFLTVKLQNTTLYDYTNKDKTTTTTKKFENIDTISSESYRFLNKL
jgi:hypothetical protein